MGRYKLNKPRPKAPISDTDNTVVCAHCRRTIGYKGKPWTFACGTCGKPLCDDCEQLGECPAATVVAHTFTCSPCRGCGDPHYVDGCLKCGRGIDGDFGNERCE